MKIYLVIFPSGFTQTVNLHTATALFLSRVLLSKHGAKLVEVIA